ncbi:helix-turn-helix domain-containing protein [Lawsonibacter asaccharolyticus]|uniref:helix-turn-helix domain-containing protein n=1 Tax=Eubacteriales TaxID=186802 RepID=UPI0023F2BF41|nr:MULTISPECIES: helix-turn-helix transcriptional regulator [Eubacteriales]UMM47735.1 helix-turn-helix domain-containing protein [Lawsonibacter asaccharolyticus]
MDIIKVFGSNVKAYRQRIGLSQEAFAEKCGMHRTYISAIECFRRSISLENIQKIADALEIEPYQLLLENRENDQNE